MSLYHPSLDSAPAPWPLGKIVCVGRNYASHARELNNPVPETPLLFIKPASSAVDAGAPLRLPRHQGPCHFELEIALLIGAELGPEASFDTCLAAVAGIGLGLDLTLRDVQAQLKRRAHPWERAKAFPGACPLTPFCHVRDPGRHRRFSLNRNGRRVQSGDSAEMLFPIERLLQEMATAFGLRPGDVVLTGTPEGVGPLQAGDRLELALELAGRQRLELATDVI